MHAVAAGGAEVLLLHAVSMRYFFIRLCEYWDLVWGTLYLFIATLKWFAHLAKGGKWEHCSELWLQRLQQLSHGKFNCPRSLQISSRPAALQHCSCTHAVGAFLSLSRIKTRCTASPLSLHCTVTFSMMTARAEVNSPRLRQDSLLD